MINLEKIDGVIVKLLGFQVGDVISYDDYYRDLRELIAKHSFGAEKFSDDFLSFLSNERKRIRNKKGVFILRLKSKKKSPTKNNIRKLLNSSEELSEKKSKNSTLLKKNKSSLVSGNFLNIVKSISSVVESIHNTIKIQSSLLKKQSEKNRRSKESDRRNIEEERLEEKKSGFLETIKKIVAPFESIFDKIIKFLVFTILGRAFKLFVDWASDPKNKEKVSTLWRFLKDWWPALLGAWFLFATPLGKFTRTIIGTIAKLTLRLSKFAIPKLLSFTKSNPLIAAGAVTGIVAGAGYMMEQNRMNDIAKQQGNQPEKRGQGDWFSEIGKAFNPGQLGMGGISPIGYDNGGKIFPFSGVVDQNTGTTVTGAGNGDTQLLPIAGGGSAVLSPGEVVLNKEQQENMYKDTGVHPASYVANIKPRTISSSILAASGGGILGFDRGGVVGINNPNFWLTSAIAGKEAGYVPQGQADVAQSIYNRAKVGIYPGGRDIRKIITAPEQYQPTFRNPGAWNAIKDRNSAIKVVGDYKLIDMASKSIRNQSLLKNSAKFVGSRTDFMGESQKKHMKPDSGDITRGKGHNFFGWFTENGYNSKMSNAAPSPFGVSNSNQKQVEKKKESSMIDKIGGYFSHIAGMANKLIGRRNGGLIKPGDGVKNPHSASDPIVIAADPYEYIFSKNAVRNAGGGSFESGAEVFDRVLATLDSSSRPAKQGKYNIEPPSKKSGFDMVTLPPITQSLGSSGYPRSSNAGLNIPNFSVVAAVAIPIRNANADLYGIV